MAARMVNLMTAPYTRGLMSGRISFQPIKVEVGSRNFIPQCQWMTVRSADACMSKEKPDLLGERSGLEVRTRSAV